MRRVLVFLEDEGRDILGFSLGGVGWGELIIEMKVRVFWFFSKFLCTITVIRVRVL